MPFKPEIEHFLYNGFINIDESKNEKDFGYVAYSLYFYKYSKQAIFELLIKKARIPHERMLEIIETKWEEAKLWNKIRVNNMDKNTLELGSAATVKRLKEKYLKIYNEGFMEAHNAASKVKEFSFNNSALRVSKDVTIFMVLKKTILKKSHVVHLVDEAYFSQQKTRYPKT